MFHVAQILVSALPIGRYPPLSPRQTGQLVRLTWLAAAAISVTVNTVYPCSYEPAAVLCIPVLPVGFFIALATFVSILFVCILVGFAAAIIFIKQARAVTRHSVWLLTSNVLKVLGLSCGRNGRVIPCSEC